MRNGDNFIVKDRDLEFEQVSQESEERDILVNE
jgi:hypothetical protein